MNLPRGPASPSLMAGTALCHAAHPRHQIVALNGLREDVVGPGRPALYEVAAAIEACDKHDRDPAGRGIGLDPAANVETVHPGHDDVQKYQRGPQAFFQRFKSRIAAGKAFHAESSPRQITAHDCRIHFLVVDDKNVGRAERSGLAFWLDNCAHDCGRSHIRRSCEYIAVCVPYVEMAQLIMETVQQL